MNFENRDLAFLLAFVLLAIVAFLIGRIVFGRRTPASSRQLQRPLVFGKLTHVLAYVLPIQFERTETLEQDLQRAGYYGRYARQEYLALRNVLVLGWIAAAIAMMYVVDISWTTHVLIIGLIGAALLMSLPRLFLQSQASGRLRRIQYALPDALDMLSMTMSGGVPLEKALQHVSGEIGGTYPDLAGEFGIIRRHMETGSLDQALRQFAKRIDIPDVMALTAVLRQTERLGSNVVQAFLDYSDDVRRGQRQRAEGRANRTSILMILPIVLCLAPPIYILLLGPAAMQLRNFVVRESESGGVLRPDTSGITSTGATSQQ
jgi:tight adherence protein C